MKTDLVVAGYVFHEDKVLLIHHKKLGLWLPVGGHINENETPDEALLREIEEEIGIGVEILNKNQMPLIGNTRKNLATPFYANVHSVGDHNHCCFFYICKAINPEKLKINKELVDYGWFSKEDLSAKKITLDVRSIATKAFGLFDRINR